MHTLNISCMHVCMMHKPNHAGMNAWGILKKSCIPFSDTISMYEKWIRKLAFRPLRVRASSVATTTNFLNQKILEIFLRQKTGEITHATLTSPKFTQNRSKLTFHTTVLKTQTRSLGKTSNFDIEVTYRHKNASVASNYTCITAAAHRV